MFHFRRSNDRATCFPNENSRTLASNPIMRSKTMPDPEATVPMGRTSSGSLFRRKRSTEDASKARARELSTRYEMSETKSSNLNKEATRKKGVSLSASGSLLSMPHQETIKMYHKQKNSVDPLLLGGEKKLRERKASGYSEASTTYTTWASPSNDSKYRVRSNTLPRSVSPVGRTAPNSPAGSVEIVKMGNGATGVYVNKLC